MKKITIILAALAMLMSCNNPKNTATEECNCDIAGYSLSDDKLEVKVGEDGSLLVLSNKETGHNYAAGAGLWRLFYNTHEEKEMQIEGKENVPVVSAGAVCLSEVIISTTLQLPL